ncbi:gamma-glutamyltransferase family protein [Parvibaculum sp. MBR-TMA-1.3b-4.2]
MPATRMSYRGMAVAPHHLAAAAARDVLAEGGNAAEAMLAAAAAIAAVYPHMNHLGGDGFWLLAAPGAAPVGIEACGPAAAAASIDFYRDRGATEAIPPRGGLAALTVPGAISGWEKAHRMAQGWGGKLPLSRLLEPAAFFARDGVAVSESQERLTAEKFDELKDVPGFAQTFLADGKVPSRGTRLRQPALADTLECLGKAGLRDFYEGEIGAVLAQDLEEAGSPLRAGDLAGYAARYVEPLSTRLSCGTVFNMPPPTQGIASLAILGIFDRLNVRDGESFAHIHGLVEATKQAFRMRDAQVCDPAFMTCDPASLIAGDELDGMANDVDCHRAAPWPHVAEPGDTIWMGVIDAEGRMASYIQSIYWEFGAGIVSPSTGVLFQNRGIGFALDEKRLNALVPGKKPFHTLNPAMARLDDGRQMVYGTMGGEGQPQTQAAIFTRHVLFGRDPGEAIAAPRWLLGRTWGAQSITLKLESDFDPALVDALKAAGHDVELVAPMNDMMGHAGMVTLSPDGRFEAASDPRSDGDAMGL